MSMRDLTPFLSDFATYEDCCGLCEEYMVAGRFCLQKKCQVDILDAACDVFKRKKVKP